MHRGSSFLKRRGGAGPNLARCLQSPFEKGIMSALFRFLVAWIIFGAIAATITFGPALLRVIAFGPISLLQVMVA